jgi:hypothetical protein
VINTTGKATEGGYATYLTYGMRLYGSQLYAGQYGIFMCGNSDIITDTAAAALEDKDAMSKVPDYNVDTTEETKVAAPFNAIVVHNSLADISMVAQGTFKNTTLSTLASDLPSDVNAVSYKDDFFLPGVDILGSGDGCGAAYFFNKNLYGSIALIRSMNADFTFDNATLSTSNGVLVQSVITYDPPSACGYLTPEEGTTVPGIAATFTNGDYTGDVLHEDYQRGMTVTIGEKASLTGKIVSGTYAAWNALWSEENLTAMLADDGLTPDYFNNSKWVEDVQTNLIRSEDTVYADTQNIGVQVTVESGAKWIVNGKSSVASLTIAEGGSVSAPEGSSLVIYTDCDASNSKTFYDTASGKKVDSLGAGTYNNVVIEVVK